MARRRRASKVEIVFETHSTTTDNERWVASGWLDGKLSPLGHRQAKELGERREDDELVAVFCSDLGRAIETAQIAFGGRGLPIFHDWRLRECNYGMLNGTAIARLEVERTSTCSTRTRGERATRTSWHGCVASCRTFRPLCRAAHRRDRPLRDEVGARPHPRGHASRRVRRRLVPLAARLALHARDRRLRVDRGTYSGPGSDGDDRSHRACADSPAPTRPRAGRERGRRRGRIAWPLRSSPLQGVGPTIARRLAKLGLATVEDVLWQRPRRYEEPAPTKRICDLFGDEEAVIEVVVRSASSRRRGRLQILTAKVADETGEIRATWFNQPWLEAKLVPVRAVRIRGRANRLGFAVSSYDLDGDAETGDFAPVYPATEDVAQKKLRDVHAQTLELVATSETTFPRPARLGTAPAPSGRARGGPSPAIAPEAEVGRTRLAFDELLVLRLALARDAAARANALCAAARRAGRAHRRGIARRSRSRSPPTRCAHWARSTRTSTATFRCSVSSRATSGRARPSSRCTRSCARSRRGDRER